MSMRKKETALSEVGFPVAKHRTNCTTSSGLGVKVTCIGAGLASHFVGVRYCYAVLSRATIAVLARMSEGGLGGLLTDTRRLIATSRFARGFSFGVNWNGIIAPVPNYGLMSHGKPSGLSLPRRRSANPCGVSHLLGGWWGISYSQLRGIQAMMLTLSRGVSTAFISTPAPVYQPVTSATAGSCEPVSYDVSSDLNAVFDRCAGEYVSANREPSLFNRTIRLNVLRGVAVDVLRFCDETLGRTYTSSKVIGG